MIAIVEGEAVVLNILLRSLFHVRVCLVREITLISLSNIGFERLWVEPVQPASGVTALTDIPLTGHAKKAVSEITVKPATVALAERATQVVAGEDGAVVHAVESIGKAEEGCEPKIVCLTGGKILGYANGGQG